MAGVGQALCGQVGFDGALAVCGWGRTLRSGGGLQWPWVWPWFSCPGVWGAGSEPCCSRARGCPQREWALLLPGLCTLWRGARPCVSGMGLACSGRSPSRALA